ncbi:AP-1 complex subunit mu-1 [Hibiscus syriacus]|uniref:AP-1 complex subunit mu-1 n=1 Tax=Hibiscus syriacus TaxID=106335 RepID=A0A6A3BMB8_HIBSY|nr:AP-1 complex subunit mu-1 [Hibiscus syriacus]
MAGAASALFLLDIKGRVLVWRDYRGDVSAAQAEKFFTKLIEKEGDPQSQNPVVYDNGVTYMFIQHSNVYLMIATRQNCNAASLLFFLHRLVDVFKHYFEELEEESLRDNFVVVYELLDEIMDFGYPQYTEAKILTYAPENDALVWKIRSFPGGKEYMLRAEFTLPSITDEEATQERKAPIRVKFEIPYFTVSGIQVRYLKIIEKSGYQSLPWVRYITMAGEYELRLI